MHWGFFDSRSFDTGVFSESPHPGGKVITVSIKVWDRIEPVAFEWERLARQTKASLFLWPGWIGAWWRAFGAGQLEILATYEGDSLAGVLPMYRFRGILRSTTNPHTPLFGFLTASEEAARQLSQVLFARRPHRIELSFLSPTAAGVPLTLEAAEAAQYRVRTESVQAAPYVDTDRTWESYESELRRKFRGELRRRQRRLEEEGRLTLEISSGTEGLDELLEEGFRVEGSGWKGEYGTSIESHPATRRFYTEVARWSAERGWLRLAFLRLDGQAIAFDYCFEYNRVHYLLKTGYDPAYKKFAPGMIIRHLMLKRAFAENIVTYDFLGEDYTWKREWTSNQQERLFLHMFAPTPLGLLNRSVFEYGRPASARARGFARSIVGERGRHLLKRGRAETRRRLGL